jgi:uncharacterized repeat protein (TIGR03803 family)
MKKLVGFRTTWFISFAFLATASLAYCQTFTTLASFNGTNGSYYPSTNLNSLLVQGTDGNFYGTTTTGGAGTSCLPAGSGCGTLFRMTPAGELTVIYSFCTAGGYPDCPDGYAPTSLILGNNGSLYGVTLGGVEGNGTVFESTLAGTLTTHNLCETDCFYSTIGAGPSSIMETTGGVFYGTAVGGGQNATGGTIFKMTAAGAFSLLYHFCSLANCADGSTPEGPVFVGRNGDVYATTAGGSDGNVYGTSVQITPAGALTVLHTFCSEANCADGANPFAGLVEGANGEYYGATYRDGTYEGGTIFDLTTTGTLTTLHSVGGKISGGWEPYGTLYLATDGNFYGTTETEGANQEGGTIFSITPSGKFTTLYSFCAQPSCADGAGPYAGVIQATDGNFYGTTTAGGTSDLGAVYKLSVGLPPFVKTVPGAGAVGAHIRILGNSLTGTTAVSFNGTAATFTVESASLIIAVVPSGATTGKVEVVTPGGTLVSNATFVVR